jgi:hypothetical protein
MSKIDAMRRQRERQFATAHPDERVQESKPPADVAADQGRCSGCGKLRAVSNGLIANHQKGLGKMCSGSRKAPA